MKKSAVEWLEDKLNNVRPTQICSIETIKEWVEQAKEMEKQQIIDAWEDGQNSFSTRTPKQYYKETFKNK